ncbi:MAG: hypothetical protein JWN17_2779 [Frankiales bacterium]|nr:hypothetical protein [Frankiales bacterium]
MSQALRIEPVEGTMTAGDGEHRVLEISLPGVPRGLVVLLCDDGGLAGHAGEVLNDLAHHGYESLAVEVAGDGRGPLPPDAVLVALQALLARAAERGWSPEQVGVLGVGSGGLQALVAAALFELGAVVSLSPTRRGGAVALPDVVATVRTPWLGLFGADDPSAPVEEVRALGRRLEGASDVFTAVVRYPGVGRDWYRSDTSDGVSYAASYDGWERVFEWLGARVAPRLTPLAEQWRAHQGA